MIFNLIFSKQELNYILKLGYSVFEDQNEKMRILR